MCSSCAGGGGGNATQCGLSVPACLPSLVTVAALAPSERATCFCRSETQRLDFTGGMRRIHKLCCEACVHTQTIECETFMRISDTTAEIYAA
eukprot:m.132617 g.132617  ORF g.132617 m.132617 type:complete len:92 (+) comp17504_c0_seq6:1889-2164(+)